MENASAIAVPGDIALFEEVKKSPVWAAYRILMTNYKSDLAAVDFQISKLKRQKTAIKEIVFRAITRGEKL